MDDGELRTYIREEFVKPGFIEVHQWKNFIDYLQILINKEIIALTENSNPSESGTRINDEGSSEVKKQ